MRPVRRVVVAVDLAAQEIAGLELDELVRPGADRSQVRRRVARVGAGVALESVFRDERARSTRAAMDGVGFEVEAHRLGVDPALRAMPSYEPLAIDAVAGSVREAWLKTTSSAVNGRPSCQRTPSSASRRRAAVGGDAAVVAARESAASTGTRLPSGS